MVSGCNAGAAAGTTKLPVSFLHVTRHAPLARGTLDGRRSPRNYRWAVSRTSHAQRPLPATVCSSRERQAHQHAANGSLHDERAATTCHDFIMLTEMNPMLTQGRTTVHSIYSTPLHCHLKPGYAPFDGVCCIGWPPTLQGVLISTPPGHQHAVDPENHCARACRVC